MTLTITTQTATVRVLAIDADTVTFDMFRQSDVVDHDDIDAFGRVHDPRDSTPSVIGRHRRTGHLVRAYYSTREGAQFPQITPWELRGGTLTVCSALEGSNLRKPGCAGPSTVEPGDAHLLYAADGHEVWLHVWGAAISYCGIPGHTVFQRAVMPVRAGRRTGTTKICARRSASTGESRP